MATSFAKSFEHGQEQVLTAGFMFNSRLFEEACNLEVLMVSRGL